MRSKVIAAVKANRTLLILFLVGIIGWVAGLAILAGVHTPIGAGWVVAGVAVGFFLYRRSSPELMTRQPIGKAIGAAVAGTLIVGVVIQVIPYGRSHSNPPVTAEPNWDSPTTRELAVVACFDCHSNEVVYPWYTNVAPFSWAVEKHVADGRDKLNYSEWDRPQDDADDAGNTVRDGSMPPFYYLVAHPDARLTQAEKDLLANGLDATARNGR